MTLGETRLVDDDRHDGGRECLHQTGEFTHETLPDLFLKEEGERIAGFPDLMFMEHRLIVAPVAHLECLKVAADLVDILGFPDHRTGQHENRIERIDAGQTMIAGFIDEDQVITERGRLGHG